MRNSEKKKKRCSNFDVYIEKSFLLYGQLSCNMILLRIRFDRSIRYRNCRVSIIKIFL